MEMLVLVALPLLLLGGILWAGGAFLWGAADAIGRTDLHARLRRERADDTYAMFREHFARAAEPDSAPENVVQTVYDHLSNRVFQRRGFPVRPMDDLQQVFDTGPDGANDLDLLRRKLAERLGCQYVPRSDSDAGPRTVEELVYDIARMPPKIQSKNPSTLLRPSESDDALLRPAAGANAESGESLLRPAEDT